MLIQPKVQVQDDGKYLLLEDYVHTRKTLPWSSSLKSWEVTIPKGFTWDVASVPRIFWSVSGVRPGGRFLAGSLIHDAFYRNGGVLPGGWCRGLEDDERRDYLVSWTRKEADLLFRWMMKESGIKWVQYHRAHWAVRAFGFFAWKEKKKGKKK